MFRLFLPSIYEMNNQIVIESDKARYISVVLRCKPGDRLIVFDGKGNCFKTEIISIGKKQVLANIIENIHVNTESNADIILLQGILKGEKMDFVIQKATELGVKKIIPLITERTQIRTTRKTGRWTKIAEEASRQSGRVIVPAIHDPVPFSTFLKEIKSELVHKKPVDKERENRYMLTLKNKDDVENTCITGLIFWEEEGLELKKAVSYLKTSPIFLVIGPEGGFTKEEILFAKENGLIVTSLGKRILRAETATILAISIIQYAVGDIG